MGLQGCGERGGRIKLSLRRDFLKEYRGAAAIGIVGWGCDSLLRGGEDCSILTLAKPARLERRGYVDKKRGASSEKELAPHSTGNDLLSRASVGALPSAAESLTSVFEMGTCVSSRL